MIKNIEKNEKVYRFQIWDTAGQERFYTITANYYRRAAGVIVNFDLNDENSIEIAQKFLNDARTFIKEKPIIIVGTKNDLEKKIPYDAIKRFSDSMNVKFIECSSKTGENVDEVFDLLLEEIIKYNEQHPENEFMKYNNKFKDKPKKQSNCNC